MYAERWCVQASESPELMLCTAQVAGAPRGKLTWRRSLKEQGGPTIVSTQLQAWLKLGALEHSRLQRGDFNHTSDFVRDTVLTALGFYIGLAELHFQGTQPPVCLCTTIDVACMCCARGIALCRLPFTCK